MFAFVGAARYLLRCIRRPDSGVCVHGRAVPVYWSGTEYAPDPSGAWFFRTDRGLRSYGGKSVGLYAVAVRPGDVTASVPEPQTLALVLLALGATAVARRLMKGVKFCKSAYEVARGSDALLVVTEWDEFSKLNIDRIRSLMAHPIIIDGRNIFDPAVMEEKGFIYKSIGR